MPDFDRRSLMLMAGLGVAAVAIPTLEAGADPGPEIPQAPTPRPGRCSDSADAAVPQFLGDGVQRSGPGPGPTPLWSVAQFRETIKNPVFWDRPENMGRCRDDREHASSSTATGNLVIRATRDGDGRPWQQVVGSFGAGINNTFEARVKFNCLTPERGRPGGAVERQPGARRG